MGRSLMRPKIDFAFKEIMAEERAPTGFLYTDKMEFHVIELPKLPRESGEESDRVELWARFLRAEREEEFTMLAKKDPYIERVRAAADHQPGQGKAVGIRGEGKSDKGL